MEERNRTPGFRIHPGQAVEQQSGLDPETCPDTRILIVGSFPSRVSLEKGEYYANPRNQFWPIMEMVLGIDHGQSYAGRIRMLHACNIALWDAVGSCTRPGSADARISVPALNDLALFVRQHPGLRLILANGSVAGRLAERAISRDPGLRDKVRLVVLPSTSPAYAALSVSAKADRWREALSSGMAAPGG